MISIVVVTYNRLHCNKVCIDKLIQNTDVPFELIIVDNGSTDGTQEWLRTKDFGDVPHSLIFNKTNLGCAKAFNEGFIIAEHDPIFRVDNDVALPENWASMFMEAWDSNPQIGIMSTNVEWDVPCDMSSYPDSSFARNTSISYISNIWHDRGFGSWCIGHRRAMFNQIGYYSLDYGLIAANDVDLQKRAEDKGWLIATASGIQVGHFPKEMEDPTLCAFHEFKFAEVDVQRQVWEAKYGTQRPE